MFNLNPESGKCLFSDFEKGYLIEVRENRRIRWLHFGDGNIQSAMLKRDSSQLLFDYAEPMLHCLHLKPDPTRITQLGLGGGGFIRYFLKHHPTVQLETVELSPTVIHVAQEYFEIPKRHAQCKVIQDDAIHHMASTQKVSDIILCDLYGFEELPQALQERAFYQDCYRQLTEEGCIAINLLVHNKGIAHRIVQQIRTVFLNNTLTLPIQFHKNLVVIASKAPDFNQRIFDLSHQGKLKSSQYDKILGLVAKPHR